MSELRRIESVDTIQAEQMRLASVQARLAWQLHEAREEERNLWLKLSGSNTPGGSVPKQLVEVIARGERLEEEHKVAMKQYRAFRKQALRTLNGEQQQLFDPDDAA